jgi:MFS family permease
MSEVLTIEALRELPQRYASARDEDRRQLLSATVDQIMDMGVAADPTILKDLGDEFPQLVLNGTLQKQFACKLATNLVSPRAAGIPPSVIDCIVVPLSEALISVLMLGAPATRDAAVEGLGGLLKLRGQPAGHFTLPDRIPVLREEDEDDETFAKRKNISDDYFERLERRHLMVLTIAEDEESRKKFSESLKEPITTKIERLCALNPVPWPDVEDALYAYPDLLRILPAIERQKSQIPFDSARKLCDAARLLTIDITAPDSITIAFARYQESVFRTIDTAIRRWDWNWSEIDAVIAAAVQGIPRSIAGTPAVCNAQIRATVAIVRTAVHLITTRPDAALTKRALKPLFDELEQRRPWPNLGILEGCYRSLFELAAQSQHDDLTDRPLQLLLEQLSRPHEFGDLIEVHRHVVASTCLRRILASAMDAGYEGHRDIEASVRALLRNPTPENIQRICRDPLTSEPVATVGKQLPVDIAPAVIASVAFESEFLSRAAAMFKRWADEPTLQRVLLTRILAAELHTLARDTPELMRHPLLRRIFTGIETVNLTDDKAIRLVWRLLSSLPPDAAETADAEIQRFVEYRGKSNDESVDDLPGYVLAMISTTASGRIAGAIARAIDLHLRFERRQGRTADFAKLLYQVTLRGPHESIFDHLLPRIRHERDRKTILLFRKHVARVLASRKDEHDVELDLPKILDHVRELEEDLRKHLDQHYSGTLKKLRDALRYFLHLTQDRERVWHHLSSDTMFSFIDSLDALAEHEDHHRDPLSNLERRLTDLHDEVIHYLALTIGNFEERSKTLTKLMDLTTELENTLRTHLRLQPPERTLLVALMRDLQLLFDDTKQWTCDEARKLKERNDRDRFWLFFCDPRTKKERIRELSTLVKPGGSVITLDSRFKIERLTQQIDTAPPPFKQQRTKFEEFFVEWMTSELDVESLKRHLRNRWPFFFRWLYGVTTSFVLTSLTILMPFVLAAWFDHREMHEWEGLGFFLVTFAMIIAGLLSFTPIIHWLAKPWPWPILLLIAAPFPLAKLLYPWTGIGYFVVTVGLILTGLFLVIQLVHWLKRYSHERSVSRRQETQAATAEHAERATTPSEEEEKKDDEEEQDLPGHWFPCLLPRLARLTAVPMALIVEFDHSYDFPLHASTWALLLLIAVSFLTTRFFVTREMVDRQAQPGGIKLTPEERRHVWQIVAVALAHSFGIAIVLSAIFSSSHVPKAEREQPYSVRDVPWPPAEYWTFPEKVLTRFDEISREHHDPRFLGLIPREVKLDFGDIAAKNQYALPPKVAEHASFKFYPTIILAWTALGLFFGVFLEGFMKGERLRGRMTHETVGNEESEG